MTCADHGSILSHPRWKASSSVVFFFSASPVAAELVLSPPSSVDLSSGKLARINRLITTSLNTWIDVTCFDNCKGYIRQITTQNRNQGIITPLNHTH